MADVDTDALKRRATAIVAVLNGRRSGRRFRTRDLRICLHWEGEPLEAYWLASLTGTEVHGRGDSPSHALDDLTESLRGWLLPLLPEMTPEEIKRAFELDEEEGGSAHPESDG
jgi:hypothetical protein